MENDLTDLFNKDFNKDEKTLDILLRQYEIYVKMSNNLSERREKLNMFFLSTNGLILTALGLIIQSDRIELSIIPIFVGLFFSLSWWSVIRYYRELNKAKFKIINEIEKQLPVKGFTKEWEVFRSQKNSFDHKFDLISQKIKIKTLTEIVRFIPFTSFIVYGILTLSYLFTFCIP